MEDLSLVPLEDLMGEIDKRFDHWIFCGMQTGVGHKDANVTIRKWKGNSATCMGLASQMQIVIFETYLNENQIRGIGEPG